MRRSLGKLHNLCLSLLAMIVSVSSNPARPANVNEPLVTETKIEAEASATLQPNTATSSVTVAETATPTDTKRPLHKTATSTPTVPMRKATMTPFPTHVGMESMKPQEIWAYIITGESGGAWLDGSRLVGWTLRAWVVYKHMPAGLAGPRWGWYGWKKPTQQAWDVVHEIWDADPRAAPFPFMQVGRFCKALGSVTDGVWWKEIGWFPDGPDFVLPHPTYPEKYSMNCYFNTL